MIRRSLTPALAVLALTACETEAPSWRLASVYDAAAISNMVPVETEDPNAAYVWVPSAGMQANCGPAKAPDGLGIFEGEAMANGLSPVLAVVLERHPDAPPNALQINDLWVSIGETQEDFRLHPSVSPRHISLEIEDNDLARDAEQVRTQMQMEMCMEHKTGRAWVAAGEQQLRQAFLLDPPDRNAGPDRKYFGGQRDPVPALLGPPDACVVYDPGYTASRSTSDDAGRGEGSLDIVPADVWGATVRNCLPAEQPGYTVQGVSNIPMRLSEVAEAPAPQQEPTWNELHVALWPPNAALGRTEIEVSIVYNGDDLVRQAVEDESSTAPASHHMGVLGNGMQVFTEPLYEQSGTVRGVKDPLGRVPYHYPTLGTVQDPGRYTVLLIPNWQIVEGLRRLESESGEQVMGAAGAGIQDGVGYVLQHPELLNVKVRSLEDAKAGGQRLQVLADGTEEMTAEWYNIGSSLRGGIAGRLPWVSYGYTTGMLSGRKPIALLGFTEPTWGQVSAAQRAGYQGLFLGALALLSVLMFAGIRRVRDLWGTVPEERVDFWPGQVLAGSEDEGEAPAADVPAGGEE